MTISKFLQTLLLRDFLSYLLPGTLMIVIVVSLQMDQGLFYPFLTDVTARMGYPVAVFVLGSIAYTSAYVVSSLLFYLRRNVRLFERPATKKPSTEVLQQLTQAFGEWTQTADPRDLSILCRYAVQVKEPELFQEKIERKLDLRNFEVSLAGMFLLLALGLALTLPGSQKLLSVLPAAFSFLILLSCKHLEKVIDQGIFNLFYVVSICHGTSGPNAEK